MYGGFAPYVSVAERRKKVAKALATLAKKGKIITPISINGRIIGKTFWGKGWCDHLESHSDYENRLPRGRTYVRNGSVVHLAVENGKVEALVQGSSLYKVQIDIEGVDKKKWKTILANCSGRIDSVIELLQGKLSDGVMKAITDKNEGLFPTPKEITLNCSCPDWAEMCKHVAAVLYGVGARLDEEPELLFKLRGCDHLELIAQASVKAPAKRSGRASIEGENLSDLFGIEVESAVPTGKVKAAGPKATKKVKKKGKAAIKRPSIRQ